MDDKWTLAEALALIRVLQPDIRRFNYHLCLGGGVLNKGWSAHDLDLYFMPMGAPGKPINPTGLEKWLTELWGNPAPIGDPQYEDDEDEGLYVRKLKYDYCGLRIDVFIANDGTFADEHGPAEPQPPPVPNGPVFTPHGGAVLIRHDD